MSLTVLTEKGAALLRSRGVADAEAGDPLATYEAAMKDAGITFVGVAPEGAPWASTVVIPGPLPLEDMDPEVVPLCEAMNLLPGIGTIESCCGHGEHPFRIWFKAETVESLPDLLYWMDGCHTGHYGWRVGVRTDCAKSPATFCVEGPVGEAGYAESFEIAALIREDDASMVDAHDLAAEIARQGAKAAS